MSIKRKLYQLEGLHPTSIDNQTFSESESDSIYCKTDDDNDDNDDKDDDDDDDDDDDVDNDTDYVVDRYIDPRIIPH